LAALEAHVAAHLKRDMKKCGPSGIRFSLQRRTMCVGKGVGGWALTVRCPMCGASPLCGVRYWGDWSGLRARCTPAVIADEKQKLHPDIRACDGTSSQPAPGQRGTAGWLARNEHTRVGVAARQSGRAVWSGRAAERAGVVHLRRHGR